MEEPEMSFLIDSSVVHFESDARIIEQRAQELLARHSHLRARASTFEFQYYETVLVVRGCVPSFYLKQLLQTVLKELEGIGTLDNQVAVVSSEGMSSVR
jgi:hypothetical protein